MKGLILVPVIACLAGATLSCSYSGSSKVLATDILNQQGEPISRATLVPLASERAGLGVGPDSAGPETKLVVFVGKPFLWDSGGDLIPPTLGSTATMIAPMVVVRRDVQVYKWLVLRKGYSPLFLTNERSSIYYTGGPLVTTEQKKAAPFYLSPGGDASRRRIINELSAPTPDKRAVGAIFDSDIDVVRLSDADRDLIRLQL